MSTAQLADQLRSLPLPDRLELAQVLWESLDTDAPSVGPDPAREAMEQAHARDADLDSGAVLGRSHEAVMQAIRRDLGCE